MSLNGKSLRWRNCGGRGKASFLAGSRVARRLADIASARIYRSLGVSPAANPLPFDWYLVAGRTPRILRASESSWQPGETQRRAALASPRRGSAAMALHADHAKQSSARAGRILYPGWLAELLLQDVGWQPGQRLIDPYAGRGVFSWRQSRQRKNSKWPLSACSATGGAGDQPGRLRRRVRQFDPRPGRSAGGASAGDSAADPVYERPDRHVAACRGANFDVLVTNPPWVGWEYLPRPYRDRLQPAWQQYSLFTAKGREAAFLKENYRPSPSSPPGMGWFKPGGRSAVVLRPRACSRTWRQRALRRLSIYPDAGALASSESAFSPASVPSRGRPSTGGGLDLCTRARPPPFPVPAIEWRPLHKGWRPPPLLRSAEVGANITATPLTARTDPADAGRPGPSATGLPPREQVLCGAQRLSGKDRRFYGRGQRRLLSRALCPLRPRRDSAGIAMSSGSKRAVAAGNSRVEKNWSTESSRAAISSCGTPVAIPCCSVRTRHLECTSFAGHPRQDHPRTLASAACRTRWRRQGFAGWERQLHAEAFYALHASAPLPSAVQNRLEIHC